LFKIVWIDIIRSGNNAVVIALAARALPAAQQQQAVLFGSGAAVVLRIALTVVAATRTILIGDQHSLSCFWQHAEDPPDGALPGHHHSGGGTDRVGWWPCWAQPLSWDLARQCATV
jgi:hypothetical protein